MSRRTNTHRGAVLSSEAAERALASLPLFPRDRLSPALQREWEGIQRAAREQMELEEVMAVLRRG